MLALLLVHRRPRRDPVAVLSEPFAGLQEVHESDGVASADEAVPRAHTRCSRGLEAPGCRTVSERSIASFGTLSAFDRYRHR